MSVGGLHAALVIGERIFLRPPTARDGHEFLALMRSSRDLHHPWVSPPTELEKYAAYLRRIRRGETVGFLVCRRQDGAIVGVINVNQIVRGAYCSGYVGYFGSTPFHGYGYVTEAMPLVFRYAFTTLKLHRLEANIQPANAASIALAKRCGFRLEGFSPRYLKIRGRWCDHQRWAICAEDWRRLRRRPARRRRRTS
jgi:ribosomal-protein-alanine N-acetyltransferase